MLRQARWSDIGPFLNEKACVQSRLRGSVRSLLHMDIAETGLQM